MYRKSMVLLVLVSITIVRSAQAQTCLEEVGSVYTPGYPTGVAAAGGYAYVAAQSSGLRVIDVSTPASPREAGFVNTPGVAWDVSVAGGYAYVADETFGLRVIDVSTPASPWEVGFVDTPELAYGVAVAGGYAYVADSRGGLRVIDASTPASPLEVGSVYTGVAYGVAVAGGYAYVAAGTSGLRVIDVSTPAAPFEVGFVDTPGLARGVAVAGGYAYVADDWVGLRVIDVSTPASPWEVGFVDTPGLAYGVAVAGGHAYVADAESGLRVIDVSTPEAPSEVGFVDTPVLAWGVAVTGGYAYVADLASRLRVIDVSCFPGGPEESCFDGLDDDVDGLVDCADPDCDGATGDACDTGLPGLCSIGTRTCSSGAEICEPDNSPRPEGPFGDPSCSDGLDNDCDGLTDSGDPDCAGPPVEICFDGIDNDGDTFVDCADPDCDGAENGLCETGLPGVCSEGTRMCSGGTEICDMNIAATVEDPFVHPTCSDGIDNDCDGLGDSEDPDCDDPQIVALGDSYSSGTGIFNYYASSGECRRSPSAYSQESIDLADLEARDFFACDGAETIHVRPEWVGGKWLKGEPPQLDHSEVNPGTDLIVLTIGGNDLRFADVLNWCGFESDCENYVPGDIGMPLKDYLPLQIDEVKLRVVKMLLEARQEAPNARIVLMGYPQLFPKNHSNQLCSELRYPVPLLPQLGVTWSPKEQRFLRGIAASLNDALAVAARAAGADFVGQEVENTFRGHEICGPDGSWINPLLTKFGIPKISPLFKPESFHPTSEGHISGYRRALEIFFAPGLARIPIVIISAPEEDLGAPSALQTSQKPERLAIWQGYEEPLPKLGDLLVEPIVPVCPFAVFVPGQELEISGGGFAPNQAVTLTLKSDADYDLGSIVGGSGGEILARVTIPEGSSPNPLAYLFAKGPGSDGAALALLVHLPIGESPTIDSDGDGVPNVCDLCEDAWNPGQSDVDLDGIGDDCDVCPEDPQNDVDSDSLCFAVDSCPLDSANDADGDGLCADLDNCPAVYNPFQEDADADLFGDACDICDGTSDSFCLVFPDGFESGNTSAWSSTVP